jgi:acetyltransferase-like isoleucine patch superfamily enzyme
MLTGLKIIISILKSFVKSIIRSIYDGQYFSGVEFYNIKNIFIHKTTVIEKGTRILANYASVNFKNICINSDCWIGRDVEIHTVYNSNVTIDNNVSIQDRCKIIGDVFIGQNSLLAPDVFLSSGNHYFKHRPYLLIKEQDKLVVKNADDFKKNSNKIFIGEDCWLGKNVMISNGVVIGRGSVIAANSFVNQNIPPYEIWGGIPAKKINKRLDFIPPKELDASKELHLPYFYFGFDHKNTNINGILSKNKSVCILDKKLDRNHLLFNMKVLAVGHLKIWFNESLIFNDELQIGPFEKKINVINFEILNFKNTQYKEVLSQDIIAHNFVEFEFIPNQFGVKNGFTILKIKNI